MDIITKNNILEYPSWCIFKTGRILLADNSFASIGASGSPYGIFKVGTGTLTRDTTNVYSAGSGSAKLVTSATTNDVTEVKTATFKLFNMSSPQPNGNTFKYLGFEFKFAWNAAFAASFIDMGIENRGTVNTIQSRIRYTFSTSQLTYENNAGALVALPSVGANFTGTLPPTLPLSNADGATQAAGDVWNCIRIVIDVLNNNYAWIDYIDTTGKQKYIFPANTAMFNAGNLGGFNEFIFFVLIQTAAAGAETMYTTDWIVTEDPQYIRLSSTGEDPF